jgi:hypothetical protein
VSHFVPIVPVVGILRCWSASCVRLSLCNTQKLAGIKGSFEIHSLI